MWASIYPPLADQASQWTATSWASVCSFKSTKWDPVISEVQSEHSSYFFPTNSSRCLSETFCLALSGKNHVCPLLWLAPFTTLDEEPRAQRGSGPVLSGPPTRSCAPLFLAVTMFPLKTRMQQVSSCTNLCPFLKLSQKHAPGINYLSLFIYPFTIHFTHEPLGFPLCLFLSFCCSPW